MCGAESSTEGVSNTEKVLGESWGQEKIIRERWMDGWGCWGDSEGLRGGRSCTEGVGGAGEVGAVPPHAPGARCCGAPRTVTPAGASCGTPSLAARRLPVWTLSIPPSPPPCSRAGGCGALGSKVLTGDRAVQSCGTEGPRCADHPRSGAEPWEVPGNRRCAAPRVPLWVAAGEVGGTEHPRPLCPPHALLLPQPGGF